MNHRRTWSTSRHPCAADSGRCSGARSRTHGHAPAESLRATPRSSHLRQVTACSSTQFGNSTILTPYDSIRERRTPSRHSPPLCPCLRWSRASLKETGSSWSPRLLPGRCPHLPLTPVQIDQVLEALDSLQASTTPCPAADPHCAGVPPHRTARCDSWTGLGARGEVGPPMHCSCCTAPLMRAPLTTSGPPS